MNHFARKALYTLIICALSNLAISSSSIIDSSIQFIENDAQLFDVRKEWLNHIEVLLPTKPTSSDFNDLKVHWVTGLSQVTIYDHEKASSITNIKQQVYGALSAEGFDQIFICENKACGSNGHWKFTFPEYLHNASASHAFIIAVRNIKENEPQEILEIYLNDIACCVRSIWRYVDRRVLFDTAEIELKFLEHGKLTLPAALFEFDSYKLTEQAKGSLDQLSQYLSSSNQNYWVVGHSDYQGDLEHNLYLSKARASEVLTYLTQNGVNQSQMELQFVGPLSPKANNNTVEGRTLNRRVELVLRPE